MPIQKVLFSPFLSEFYYYYYENEGEFMVPSIRRCGNISTSTVSIATHLQNTRCRESCPGDEFRRTLRNYQEKINIQPVPGQDLQSF